MSYLSLSANSTNTYSVPCNGFLAVLAVQDSSADWILLRRYKWHQYNQFYHMALKNNSSSGFFADILLKVTYNLRQTFSIFIIDKIIDKKSIRTLKTSSSSIEVLLTEVILFPQLEHKDPKEMVLIWFAFTSLTSEHHNHRRCILSKRLSIWFQLCTSPAFRNHGEKIYRTGKIKAKALPHWEAWELLYGCPKIYKL